MDAPLRETGTTSLSIHLQSESWSMRRLSLNAVMELVLITESGANGRKAVQKAKEQLEQTGTPFLGVVSFNKFNIKATEYGSYGGYGSYGEYGKKVKNRSRENGRRKNWRGKINDCSLSKFHCPIFSLHLWAFLRMQNIATDDRGALSSFALCSLLH